MTPDIIEKVAALPCFDNPTGISPLGGGLTNVNLLVSDQGQKFVVRLGADIVEHGVMRWNELALSKAAAAAGFAPKVVHSETGVMVIEHIEARTFTPSDVQNPENLTRIIELMRRVHVDMGKHLTEPVLTFWPFQVNRTYTTRLRADGSAYSGLLPEMLEQLDALEAATGPIDMVIGHNDLLAANILDDGKQLWLIDWEYGGFNSPLFDLAGLASNNDLTESQERGMLQQYFGSDSHWRSYQAMKCASLMRETLWSMTSEIHSTLNEDFGAYTAENLDKFHSAMAAFTQL